jgi:hypothetical protein
VTQTTLRRYLERGQDALGWPMIPPLYGVHAARLGERDLSLEMFERGVADYVIEPFLQMDEFGCEKTKNKPKVGPYLAHCGAFIMDLIYGLPGLQLSQNAHDWPRFPVVLPRGWEAIEIERLWVNQRPARLIARDGDERAQIITD